MKKINLSKIHFSILIIAFALIAGIVVQSCQVNDDSPKDILSFKGQNYTLDEVKEEAEKLTEKDYSYVYDKLGISKVSYVSGNSKTMKTLKLKGKYKIVKYQFKKTDEILYIAQDIENSNMYKAFKVFEKNGEETILGEKQIDNRKLLSDKKYDKKNQDIISLSSLFTLNTANAELCKRKAGETQSSCESRSYDEFVKDCFACWVAYWGSPGVAILLSALCLCQE
ncbi:hypothetical protein [Flavobacterium gilvum]|uniref:Lipoprotein n=1 Tax=Flavobacterium gilvum TaxID=1492737 RepID=A0AAC9N7J6_9FLAO|nr:hypothetical protein [Flavobacterium gilvum]AOW10603.1 hypothetical protein EM308_14490 [Flavobacterium gilvum]KFC57842.1 hypothetical protein FEM08_33710 [Flavobacterium gilvum]